MPQLIPFNLTLSFIIPTLPQAYYFVIGYYLRVGTHKTWNVMIWNQMGHTPDKIYLIISGKYHTNDCIDTSYQKYQNTMIYHSRKPLENNFYSILWKELHLYFGRHSGIVCYHLSIILMSSATYRETEHL